MATINISEVPDNPSVVDASLNSLVSVVSSSGNTATLPDTKVIANAAPVPPPQGASTKYGRQSKSIQWVSLHQNYP